MTKVDYVVEVDQIGDPKKIATGAAKPTTDMRKLMMADYCTQFVVNTPYFKDGFSYQTGVGGASIASTISLAKVMKERIIRMRFGVGGLTKPMCDLLINGQVDALLDTQDFDLAAVESVKDLHHFRISAGEYANPFNKGAVVNKLDFVILAALEVDVHFNCNVVVDSNGMITGAQGGHPDTAAGAKCAIVIAPLLQGRTPAICTDVTTVTTPGESVDVVITDYGIAINPKRQDLIEAMKDVDLPFKTIEPSSGFSRRFRQRKKVVLPEPLGPRMATNSLSRRFRLTSSSAFCTRSPVLYSFLMWLSWSMCEPFRRILAGTLPLYIIINCPDTGPAARRYTLLFYRNNMKKLCIFQRKF